MWVILTDKYTVPWLVPFPAHRHPTVNTLSQLQLQGMSKPSCPGTARSMLPPSTISRWVSLLLPSFPSPLTKAPWFLSNAHQSKSPPFQDLPFLSVKLNVLLMAHAWDTFSSFSLDELLLTFHVFFTERLSLTSWAGHIPLFYDHWRLLFIMLTHIGYYLFPFHQHSACRSESIMLLWGRAKGWAAGLQESKL